VSDRLTRESVNEARRVGKGTPMESFEGSTEKLKPPSQPEIRAAVAKSSVDVRRVIRGLELRIRQLATRLADQEVQADGCGWCGDKFGGRVWHLDGQQLCKSCFREYQHAIAIGGEGKS